MPTMPSFNSWAPKPDLAGAYDAGGRIGLARSQAQSQINLDQQRMAIAAAQAQQEMQLAQQKLAAESQQAEMELMAKEKYNHMQELRHQQELEMDRAYKAAQLGMKEREIKNQQDRVKSTIETASQRLAAQNAYQSLYSKYIASGLTPQEASQKAILESGPAFHGGAGSAAVRGNQVFSELGKVATIPELKGKKTIRTGPNSIMVVDEEKDLSQERPIDIGIEGKALFNNKLISVPNRNAEIRKQIKALRESHDKDTPGGMAFNKEKEGEKLTATYKLALSKYKEREARIKKLEEEVEKSSKGSSIPGVIDIPKIDSGSLTNKYGKYKFGILK